MTTETLDIAEAAALLKVDTETVRQLAADGAGTASAGLPGSAAIYGEQNEQN